MNRNLYIRTYIANELGFFSKEFIKALTDPSTVYYKADLGAPYLYDSISYMEPWLEGVVGVATLLSYLHIDFAWGE